MTLTHRPLRPLMWTVLLLGCGSSATPNTAEVLNIQPQDGAVPQASGPTLPGVPSGASQPSGPEPALDAGTDAGTDASAAGDAGEDGGVPRDASLDASLDGALALPWDAALPKARAFPAVTDFGAAGPVETVSEEIPADCTVYRPAQLGENGLVHPVILWGNGTGTPTAEVYAGFFKQWASHGFIVGAAHTAFSGSGKEMLACLDWLEAQNTSSGSLYEGKVDAHNAGASGHSQGGGGTVEVGQDPRVKTTIPLQAWMGNSPTSAIAAQRGPVFLVSGTDDIIAPADLNQKPIFEGLTVPTFWGTLKGGDHVSIALGGVEKYLAPTTAWFRLFLMDDQSARPQFYGASCVLCTSADWTVQRKQIN